VFAEFLVFYPWDAWVGVLDFAKRRKKCFNAFRAAFFGLASPVWSRV
jgi:hypothetical protein